MEMTRTEFAAVDGVACDVLDSLGRLVITPHALSIEGQTNVPADLRPGESLEAFLARHVPGIHSGAWSVSLGGRVVPQAMWARTYPKHGHLIACRCVVQKAVLSLVAMAALAFFAPQFAVSLLGAGAGASALGMGLIIAGSMLINKVLAPKVPKPADNGPGRSVYSLSGQRNSIRAYEPLPVLWGEMRITPDLASLPYTWNAGDDQYLSTILLGGINVHRVTDVAIGDTAIGTYEGVELYHNGFSGTPSVYVPLYSNADTIAGAELVKAGPWVTRTSSSGTIALQVDIEGQLFDVDSKGGYHPNPVPFFIETRPVGGVGIWSAQVTDTLDNASAELMRRTFTIPVSPGQYDVRVRIGTPRWNDGDGKDACKLAWTVLKSIQPDATDYSQWGRLGIKIKASGQLSGSLDTLRATYTAKPIPVWNGIAWVNAETRANGLSNPGAIILQTLRGIYAGSVLQFGFGMQDAQIDIEGLKSFMLHCTAKGYTYDRWITSGMSLQAFCDEVALAGMGQFVWTDGGRPTVAFVGSGQPIGGVVNMANMLKGSFSVAYNLSNAADGIEYQYLDRDRNWETQTLRVMAPGVTTMLSPARITGEGVTSEAQAAVLARYHLAQSLYQYKTIDFAADIEHLDYRRLSVLSVSHDLTQWGFGGRVVSAETLAGKVVLTLDEEVPTLPTRYVGLRVPGARDYRVFGVEAFAGKTNVITLVGAWPAGVAFPGGALDNPAHDTLWCYDFKETPGYRVRVVSIEPQSDLKGANVTCVPEGPEFWDYVLNGTYVPAPNQSSLPLAGRPVVSNLRISEQTHLQGDTEWYELHAVWDVEGDYDHAQVWAGMDGSELRLVDGNAVSARSSFRIESAGEWLIEVRPFSAGGLVGQSAAVLYITSRTNIAPRNVDQFVVQVVEGGLRRFAWQYTGDRPPAFAGVQIRYLPGDVPLSEAGWDAMTPLGKADDIYSAQFESTRPAAGQWTFGIRAINTSGLLSPGVLRFAINLPASLPAAQAPDLTPPPKPTGVTATALMSTAQVNWTAPSYTVGRGHDHSIISAAVVVTGQPVPVFSAAVKVGAPEGQPASIPVELGGVKYRLWVQHVSKEGVASLPSDPVEITTSVDPVKILEILAGQIGTSQLNASLSTPIGLITAPAGTVGSVNARIEAQRSALQANIDAVQSQLAEVTGAAEYVAGTTYTVGKLAKYQGKLYRAKSTTTGNLPTNTTYWELVGEYASIGEAVAAHAVQLSDQLTRIQNVEGGLAAEVSDRTTLATKVLGAGDPAGKTLANLSAGLLYEERQARSNADSTEVTKREALSATLTGFSDPTGKTLAQLTSGLVFDEKAARVRDVQAEAEARQLLEAVVSNPTTGLAATATSAAQAYTKASGADDKANAQAGQISTLSAKIGGSANLLTENWGGADPLTKWETISGTGEKVIATVAGTTSGKVLRLGNNAGNDQIRVGHLDNILYDPAKVYRVTVKARRVSGSGFLYVGWTGIAANGTTYVNIVGGNTSDNAHYHTVNNETVGAAWATYTGYTSGSASSGTGTVGTQAVPAKMHSGAVFIRPQILANYNSVAGTFEIDSIVIDDMSGTTGLYAAIETEATVRASETAGLLAQYTVKVEANGYVSGFGLANTLNNGVPISSFIVKADRFSIAAPGSTAIVPFAVQASAQTVNGVSVPAGVYMDSAYINNVTALWGRFGTLVADKIQATEITAARLLTGALKVGTIISSTSYVAGSNGWQIKADGSAEFSGVVVRGHVVATSGSIGGVNVYGGSIQSANWTTGASGFVISSTGAVEFQEGLIGRVRISGGGISSGNIYGWAWPAAGEQGGMYLGPNGLLLGNRSNGKYVQIDSGGDLSAPGINLVNGVLDITQANVLGTLQVRSGEITANIAGTYGDQSISTASGEVVVAYASMWMPAGSSGVICTTYFTGLSGNYANFHMWIYRNGTSIAYRRIFIDGDKSAFITLPVFDQWPAEGNNYYEARIQQLGGPTTVLTAPTMILQGGKR